MADAEAVDEIVVRWPDGIEDRFNNVSADRVVEYTHTRDFRPTRRGSEAPSIPVDLMAATRRNRLAVRTYRPKPRTTS